MRQLYGHDRKIVKWGRKLFFEFVDMTIVNSFVVYKETNACNISFFDFKREVAQGLLTLGSSCKSSTRKRRHIDYSIPRSVRLVNVGVHF